MGQLAAHGILSGYPDGTYKGKQPTTRYEMASALARALAVVDMTKASKQDVEMLKKLVVEFKDELEALGVRVDDLDERVKVIEERLGGWKMHGELRFDIRNSDREAPEPDNQAFVERARLWFERYFGEDEEMFFRARLDNTRTNTAWQQFYVTMPFFADTKLYVGKFLAWEEMAPYYLGGDTAMPETGGFVGLDDFIGDRQVEALGLEKAFSMGTVRAYLAHPWVNHQTTINGGGGHATIYGGNWGAWELALMGAFQFTEQFGFDIGGHAFIGDNADDGTPPATNMIGFSNMWTLWAGLRFNFNENIAFKGIFYHQQWNGDVFNAATGWQDADRDSANHWRLVLDVNQELLKFTSLWLEYGQMKGGFMVPTGLDGQGAMFSSTLYSGVVGNSYGMVEDMKYWRIALGQQWNEKWATHLFYYGYNFDTMDDMTEWGLGVQYTYNPSVKFGLNYVKADWDRLGDDHIIRFRTTVTF
ncbi:MAG: S-layer homology domain-containing protein [Fretibacterium sp.]|nr:S-layer homology domain-containing protein [Fretibacterium sp.]